MAAERSKSVLVFACLAGALILLSAFCTDRDGSMDELGFQNPPYMLSHFGKLTFPSYSHNSFFDLPVITHPPLHLASIGLLQRLGFSMYYAEATPTVLLLLLAILIVVFSQFPNVVKLGWLFSLGFLGASGDSLTLCFGVRPEGELHAAWFCGLLLLESARLANWNRFRLFAGALFLAWASCVHYYALPAFTGAAVYAVWAWRSLPPKQAKPVLVALAGGLCLVGIPFLAFYAIPHFQAIYAIIRQNQGSGGMAQSVAKHFAIYRDWAHNRDLPALIRAAALPGIPLMLVSTAILAAVRSTRGIALAALPLQLFIFLFASHKMPFYLLHEAVLFAAAIAIGTLSLASYLIARFTPALARAITPAAALLLSAYLITGAGPMLAHARISFQPRIHELEIAHAAGRAILGPHARVGGRWVSWYTSGAEHSFDIEHDLLSPFLLFDPPTYFRNLDAVADCDYYGDPDPIAAWYADGTLQLRGFYFGQTNSHLRCVLLSSPATRPLNGYAMAGDQLFQFQQDPAGSYEVLSAVCPAAAGDWYNPREGIFSAGLQLPGNAADRLVTVLAPRSSIAPAGPVGATCRELSAVRGTLLFADWKAMLAQSRKDDPPMRFYHNLDEMPGYSGVGLPPSAAPPTGAVPSGDTVDIAAAKPAHGRVDTLPQLRVTTQAGPGTFAALLPITHAASPTGACWVVLRVRVLSGRVGFAAFDSHIGILARTLDIEAGPNVQTIALSVPDCHNATDIALFNQSSLVGGQLDVLSAAILVKP